MRAKRDYAMLAMLFGCGFRRSELVGLELDEIQMRQGHWAVVDLVEVRVVTSAPSPFRIGSNRPSTNGHWQPGSGRAEFSEQSHGWEKCGATASRRMSYECVRKTCCERAGLEHIAPHDLRRTLREAMSQQWG